MCTVYLLRTLHTVHTHSSALISHSPDIITIAEEAKTRKRKSYVRLRKPEKAESTIRREGKKKEKKKKFSLFRPVIPTQSHNHRETYVTRSHSRISLLNHLQLTYTTSSTGCEMMISGDQINFRQVHALRCWPHLNQATEKRTRIELVCINLLQHHSTARYSIRFCFLVCQLGPCADSSTVRRPFVRRKRIAAVNLRKRSLNCEGRDKPKVCVQWKCLFCTVLCPLLTNRNCLLP